MIDPGIAEKGETLSLGLNQFADRVKTGDTFGVIFEGFLNVPAEEIYEFSLMADDGAVLYIDDEPAVDNDGLHSSQVKTGLVPLKKGYHRFQFKYFEGGGDLALEIKWGIKGTALRNINGGDLIH